MPDTARNPLAGPQRTPIALPLNGVSDITSFMDTEPGTCPPENMRNAIPLDSARRRLRLGTRWRLGSKFTNAIGEPWQAPSYIQGFAQVNIAEQTRVETGALADSLLTGTLTGSGHSYPGTAPSRDGTFINNADYQGNLGTPPPTVGATDYQTYFGTGQAIAGGETPTGLTSPASRWDRFAATNTEVTHGKDQLLQVYNYHVTDAGLGKTIARARLVASRKNLTTGVWEMVNEYEISDGGHAGAPTNGKFSFSQSGDASAPWHISVNDIDIGEDAIYVALLAYQTTGDNYDGAIIHRRGWVLAIIKSELAPGTSPHTYPPTGQATITPWGLECIGVRYRSTFSPTITVDDTVYGGDPDVLVLFLGIRDFWSGVARFNTSLTTRRRMGEVPTWANPGHGPLKPSYVGASEASLDAAISSSLIDGDHLTTRFSVVSEQQRGTLRADRNNDMSVRWSHGCLPIGLDIDNITGEVYVARTAVGFGVADPDGAGGYASPPTYSSANLPSDTTPSITVMCLTPSGRLKWEVNTHPRNHTGGWNASGYGPFYNDRVRPTLTWISADQRGGCVAVGRWAQNRNVWHCKQSVTTSTVGVVDWSKGIGVPSGNAKDSSGTETRPDGYGETVGIAELTMLYCDAHRGDSQYVITGESFAQSNLVDQAHYIATLPPAGLWNIYNTGDNGGKVTAYSAGSVWKLAQTGAAIWKRYLGSAAQFGTTAELITLQGSSVAGAYLFWGHSRLTGTAASASSGWTFDAPGHFWWLRNEAPPTRQVVIFNPELGINEEYVLRLRKRVHEIKALVKASPDGKDGWEVGVHNDAGTFRLIIRKVTDGTPSSTFSDDALLSDLGLTVDDQTYDLRVRIRGITIEAFLNTQPNQDVPAVSADIDAYFSYNRIGFATNFQTTANGGENQAPYLDSTAKIVRVTAADIFTLISRTISESQVLCIFSDGQLFVVKDGVVVEAVAGLNFPPQGLIRAAQHRQKLRIVTSIGGYAKVYDSAADPGSAITNWAPTAGSLPGATSDGMGGFVAGTTTATFITQHLDRVWLGGMPEDPQNVEYSALGDSDDWDKNSLARPFGKASNLSNEIAGVVGVPILSLHPYSDDRLIMGSENQINALFGDPEFESSRVNNVTREAGLLGPESLAWTDGGGAFGTTDHGPITINGDQLSFYAANKLYKYAFPETHDGTVHISVIHVGGRKGLLFHYTQVDKDHFSPQDAEYFSTSLPSVHLWYSEQTQNFYPVDYPEAADPICVFNYKGETLLGCRDGFIRTLTDSQDEDFLTTTTTQPVTCYIPSALIQADYRRDRIHMVEQFTILSDDTVGSPTLYLKGESTAESVYGRAPTDGDLSFNLTPGRNISLGRLSNGAMLLTYVGTEPYAIESVSIGVRLSGRWRTPLVDVAPTIPAAYHLGVCPSQPPSGGVPVSPTPAIAETETQLVTVLIYTPPPGGGAGPGSGTPIPTNHVNTTPAIVNAEMVVGVIAIGDSGSFDTNTKGIAVQVAEVFASTVNPTVVVVGAGD